MQSVSQAGRRVCAVLFCLRLFVQGLEGGQGRRQGIEERRRRVREWVRRVASGEWGEGRSE